MSVQFTHLFGPNGNSSSDPVSLIEYGVGMVASLVEDNTMILRESQQKFCSRVHRTKVSFDSTSFPMSSAGKVGMAST